MSVPSYAKDVLVDADWAIKHIGDPDIRFVEVDVDTNAYDEGHIPGAVAWNWTSQLSDGVRRDIVGREDLGRLLSESGIGPETTIVLYGDNNNWFAAWAYWQLNLFGIHNVKILDGGRKYWVAQALPTSTDVPSYEPTGIQVGEADFGHRAFRDDVLSQIDAPGALVDVRSPAEFNGELLAPAALPQEGAQRAGHVPGAANIPWASAVNDDGTFKSADELRELYAAKGITGDKDVIAYCRIGERSSHTWFVLHELLGFDRVRNYDGSWTEYGSLVGVPIEKSVPALVS
jgi:thiosulfate/3-mercaptopyruvate sulfurtransferase